MGISWFPGAITPSAPSTPSRTPLNQYYITLCEGCCVEKLQKQKPKYWHHCSYFVVSGEVTPVLAEVSTILLRWVQYCWGEYNFDEVNIIQIFNFIFSIYFFIYCTCAWLLQTNMPDFVIFMLFPSLCLFSKTLFSLCWSKLTAATPNCLWSFSLNVFSKAEAYFMFPTKILFGDVI